MVGLEVYILNTNVFFGDGLMVKQDFFFIIFGIEQTDCHVLDGL